MKQEEKVDIIRNRITDEIFFAVGAQREGTLQKIFGRLFYRPTNRFAEIFAEADDAVGTDGFSDGCKVIISRFEVNLEVHGAEYIPRDGPVLFVSNHPGAYDSLAVGAHTGRKDLHIIVSDSPIFYVLPNASKHFMYAANDTMGRMIAIRQAIAHLQRGGAFLTFATGTIDPDPAIMPGAADELEDWSPAVEIMLRKAPETRLVLVIASGMVLPRFAFHPITRLFRKTLPRRRIAEVIQILQHLMYPHTIEINGRLSFALPVSIAQLEAESEGRRLMPAIIERARSLLDEHMQQFYPNT